MSLRSRFTAQTPQVWLWCGTVRVCLFLSMGSSRRLSLAALVPTSGTGSITLIDHALFFCVGLGTGYLVPVALFLQLPILQKRLPEGICLASEMNVGVNTPILLACVYVLYRARPARFRRKKHGGAQGSSTFRRDCLVVLLLTVNVFAAMLAALTWFVTLGRVSFFLFVACFLAGLQGSMGAVVVAPWVSRTSASLIPAVNTGGAASLLLLGLLDIAEGPGEESPRFGASAFFGVCAGVCTVPLMAYVAINLRRRQEGRGGAIQATREIVLETTTNCSSSTAGTNGGGGGGSSSSIRGGYGGGSGGATAVPPAPHAARDGASATADPEGGDGACAAASGSSAPAEVETFEVIVLEDVERPQPSASAVPRQEPGGKARPSPSVRPLWQCILINFSINFVCWGLQPSLVPIAVHRAVPVGAGDALALQICTMVSYTCVTLGHGLTNRIVTYRLVAITALYMLLAMVFLFASFEVGGSWHSTGGIVAVVALVGSSRFLDGFFTSLLQMEICASHDGAALGQERKEHVLRMTGIGGSIGTLAGTLLSYVLVTDSCVLEILANGSAV